MLGVAVEAALDHLLGQLDRELRHPALEVSRRTLGREGDILARPLADLGRLGLGPRRQVAFKLVGRLASLLDDPSRLAPGVGQLTLVVGQHRLGLGLRPLGPLEVAADPVLALLHHVAHAGERELPQHAQQDQERQPAPDDLVGRGEDGAGRLLAVVDLLALLEELVALLGRVVGEVDLLALVAALTGSRDPGRSDDRHDGDDGCCEQHSDAHRCS